MNKVSTWLWGLVLVIIGVIWGLNATGLAQIDIFFPGWWTLFIIIPCFIGLFNKDESKTGDIIGLVIGFCLLFASLGWFNFRMVWALIMPLILVAIGLSMMFQGVLKSKVEKTIKNRRKNSQGDVKGEKKEYWATFSSMNLKFRDEKVSDMRLESVFGGLKCNLDGAIIEEDLLIETSSVFGSVALVVPEEVKVEVVSTNIFGGVSDKRKKHHSSKEQTEEEKDKARKTRTIFVNANCLFGGLEIRNA